MQTRNWGMSAARTSPWRSRILPRRVLNCFDSSLSWAISAAPSAVAVDSPKVSGLAAAQKTYIQNYVQAFDDAVFSGEANGWPKRDYNDYIDRASFVDHHILNTLALDQTAATLK